MFDSLRSRFTKKSLAAKTRRQFMLTRVGFHFVFVAVFAMVGGALRGFNLLLILAGVLVGAVLMQWRYSRSMIGGLRVHRRLPIEAIAGVPFRIRYRVRNSSRLMAAWMIWVEDRFGRGGAKRIKRDEVVGKCSFGYIAPKATMFSHVDCVFSQRGRYRFGPLSVASTFPFSLLTSRRISYKTETLHVFPRLVELRGGWQNSLLSRSDGVLPGANNSGMSEGEFFGLREWRSGDNPRWIHWRTSARLNELAVRQFEQHRRFDLCVLLDGFDSAPREDGFVDVDSSVEFAISLAATLVIRLTTQPVNRIALAIAASRTWISEASASGKTPKTMLRHLSETNTTSTVNLRATVSELQQYIGPARDLLVISPRSLEHAIGDDELLKKELAPWVSHGTFRWLDVTQSETMRWIGRPTNGVSVEVQRA
tara:strand:+ start:131618 stop:132886 length:1269 start_codon:yes stop_codon:yes gene_type:complete